MPIGQARHDRGASQAARDRKRMRAGKVDGNRSGAILERPVRKRRVGQNRLAVVDRHQLCGADGVKALGIVVGSGLMAEDVIDAARLATRCEVGSFRLQGDEWMRNEYGPRPLAAVLQGELCRLVVGAAVRDRAFAKRRRSGHRARGRLIHWNHVS